MARSRSPAPGPVTKSPNTQPLAEEVRELRDAVTRLSDEVAVLRSVLDEVRDELGWVCNNREEFRCPHPVMHITSMPLDPLAPDFGERVNKYSAKDLAELSSTDTPAPPTRGDPSQRDLFS